MKFFGFRCFNCSSLDFVQAEKKDTVGVQEQVISKIRFYFETLSSYAILLGLLMLNFVGCIIFWNHQGRSFINLALAISEF